MEITVSSDRDQTVLYEFPLNEQVRTYLRIESLFDLQLKLKSHDSVASHIAACHNLLEILGCLERGDIKADLLKELEQQKLHFNQLAKNPYIDELKLKTFLKQLEQLFQWIRQYPGKFGSKLKTDPFIELLNNRLRIPGGSCSFDIPELHQFMSRSLETRQAYFNECFTHFKGLHQCVKILLRLFRENAPFETQVAIAGCYQDKNPKNKSAQLVRVKLPASCLYFPEVSGSKLCFYLRFLVRDGNEVKTVTEDIPFDVAVC